MIQQLQNQIFREFEPQEYYARHFKEGIREDGRKLQQSREISVNMNSVGPGSCLMTIGSCIITVQIRASLQEIPVSPLTNDFTLKLINVQATLRDQKHATHHDRVRRESKLSLAIQEFLKRHHDIRHMVVQSNNKNYGYVLNVDVRLLTEDGSMEEYCLLAVQLAYSAVMVDDFGVEGGKAVKKGSPKPIRMQHLYYPISYCELYGEMLLDPSAIEEDGCQYRVCVLWDVHGKGEPIVRKCGKAVNTEILIKIVELTAAEKDKVAVRVDQIQEKAKSGRDFSLIISGL